MYKQRRSKSNEIVDKFPKQAKTPGFFQVLQVFPEVRFNSLVSQGFPDPENPVDLAAAMQLLYKLCTIFYKQGSINQKMIF